MHRKAESTTPKVGRPHTVASARPKGRPPTGTTWDSDKECYVNDDGEEYQKVETFVSTKPKGRPPTGAVWSEELQMYVNDDGEEYRKVTVEKVASNKPKGRPPKGKVWSEADGAFLFYAAE